MRNLQWLLPLLVCSVGSIMIFHLYKDTSEIEDSQYDLLYRYILDNKKDDATKNLIRVLFINREIDGKEFSVIVSAIKETRGVFPDQVNTPEFDNPKEKLFFLVSES